MCFVILLHRADWMADRSHCGSGRMNSEANLFKLEQVNNANCWRFYGLSEWPRFCPAIGTFAKCREFIKAQQPRQSVNPGNLCTISFISSCGGHLLSSSHVRYRSCNSGSWIDLFLFSILGILNSGTSSRCSYSVFGDRNEYQILPGGGLISRGRQVRIRPGF